jgi:hypothetical protein
MALSRSPSRSARPTREDGGKDRRVFVDRLECSKQISIVVLIQEITMCRAVQGNERNVPATREVDASCGRQRFGVFSLASLRDRVTQRRQRP